MVKHLETYQFGVDSVFHNATLDGNG